MASSIDKTKLGAGDGLRTPTLTRNNKLNRTPVSSSRRFTPRTPSLDNERSELTKQKLQEAIDNVTQQGAESQLNRANVKVNPYERTPIPARCKRAQTVAEITPSKKVVVRQSELFGAAKDQGLTMTKKASAGTLGTIVDGVSCLALMEKRDEREDERRVRNEAAAGRRVYSQLLLNAWRHKRRDAAILVESSTQLQQQVQQLQMQVDVLQQLRQSEGRRRSEAAQDNCQLKTDLQKCEEKCRELLHEKDELLHKQEELESNWTFSKMELVLEQENVVRINQALRNEERNVADGVAVMNELKKEREYLENKVKSLGEILERENRKVKNFSCDIVNLENTMHGEMLRNSKYVADLDTMQNLLKTEREQTTKLKHEMFAMEQHQIKNSQKLFELKKRVTVINDIKRRVLQDNCDLKSIVAEMQILLQKEREKPWWRASGQLMYTFVHNAAYLLLPNLPNNNFYDRKRITDRNTTPDMVNIEENIPMKQ